MPELPEVETMRRGIDSVVGSRIVAVERPPCPRKPISLTPALPSLRKRLVNHKIDRTGRAGKRVVLWLTSGEALIFEPRMTGLVLLVDPPTTEHLRLRLRLSGGPQTELLYWDRRGLGNVHCLSAKAFGQRYGLAKLGPDALDITAEQFAERLGSSARMIKVALLDQRAVAGIGNLYAVEILHVAGIHPERQCRLMSDAQWEALTAATHAVLSEAIRYEGSTLSDGTYRNALNQVGGYQNEHRVYNRAGELCPRCGGTIQRVVHAQRSTFFCGKCQTKRGANTGSI
ncbi:bifunctional DNA-formamidopyrimidine glycosylase/DNA-(apurinic or apyrimidinic site) lyase [Adhaeretor mobilis]|uniref:Formamidopyrimidine-DNA glycosylase n=1 Tax=Adhaeretor mobilis TaxID=1930276 RepID=A0A517MZN1_9BACT|nr:bifunctional DNA-formamidopyrimidine glycosylase/DNA-(apurinic or apyrimidinic site) lyase [Adhaeretor mobilis]QDT00314.1 Formamidopyrimidine-DNA glycosylase [Adhaeretor mobilis]